MMDYMLLTALNAIGASILMAVLFVLYRRGIAIRLGVLILAVIIPVDTLSFFLGREGIATGRSIVAVALALGLLLSLCGVYSQTLSRP